MNLWRQLRWRIVGSHLLIVIAGVVILLLATETIQFLAGSAELQAQILAMAQAQDAPSAAAAADAVLAAFRTTLLIALVIAAGGALVAGVITSVLLTRVILRPLREITQSSRRIADGHYGERVAIPDSDELALVAINFNQMAEALEKIEQQRVALIGNVSHELRTPLSGIEGYLEGMMDGVLPGDSSTFAPMYQEVRRLRRLIDDLQAISRFEAGQFSLHLAPFDVLPVIRQLLTQLTPQANAQGLEFTVTTTSPQVWVLADSDRTAQVLVNLIGNAIRYSPEPGTITVAVSCTAQMAHMAVTDSGLGIPAESLPYVFERFYRVDPSRSRSSGGSGIGLTIARHLAWAMGGELTASSPGLGQGSTFVFTLPLATPIDGR